MPRTIDEIRAHADDLAKRFEDYEPQAHDGRDATALRELRRVFEDTARAQERLAEAVALARADGHSWAAIGAMIGTSGEAARQRFGTGVVAGSGTRTRTKVRRGSGPAKTSKKAATSSLSQRAPKKAGVWSTPKLGRR
jgi:hypothetical protein